MAFFLKTRSTNKITPLHQKFTLRKIRLVFLFLNLFSHMKNLFSVYYQFKEILKQRKVTILSLRTGDRLIYMGHKISGFIRVFYYENQNQNSQCLFYVFTLEIQKIKSLRTFITFWSKDINKDITVQKIYWFLTNKNLTESLKHRGVLYVLSLFAYLARNSQIAGFFKRQLLRKQK